MSSPFADDDNDHDHEHDHEHLEPSPEIDATMEELRRRAEKRGLYLRDAMVVSTDSQPAQMAGQHSLSIRDAIENGAQFMVMAGFQIGDQAFSTRVMNPEQYEVDKEAQVLIPDPAEELKRRLQEGGALFGDDDLEFPDDDEDNG